MKYSAKNRIISFVLAVMILLTSIPLAVFPVSSDSAEHSHEEMIVESEKKSSAMIMIL